MNYAEDRLDRRARYSKENENGTATLSPLEADLNEARRLFQVENDLSKAKGHELAGRTLRDCGKNRQALFHYGQAWIRVHQYYSRNKMDTECNHEDISNHYANCRDFHANKMNDFLKEEEKAVGDYAQMAEFNGFPELGIIALLFYFNGGTLSQDDANVCSSSYVDVDMGVYKTSEDVNSFIIGSKSIDGNNNSMKHGIDEDSKQKVQGSVYVPTSITSSKTTYDIISSFEEMFQCMKKAQAEDSSNNNADSNKCYNELGEKDECRSDILSACEILDKIAKQSLAKKQAKKAGHKFRQKQQSNTEVPSSKNGSGTPTAPTTTIIINNLLHFWDSSLTSQKPLSPLLQILLLKLLYVNPLGGPFLYLATEALYHLSISSMPLDSSSSDLSKYMAKNYKSHWAYYVLMCKIVFGERIKKHRIQSGHIPYHVPVWDIVHGLDERKGILSFGKHVSIRERQPVTDTPINKILASIVSSTLCTSKDCSSSPKPSVHLQTLSHAMRKETFSPIYALGDSHVLSIGWQTIKISMKDRDNFNNETKYRTIIPYPVTGLKAWHTRPSTKFFTNSNLRSNLNRLPSQCKTIILSTGEIDCREGIGGTTLQGFYNNCDDAVHNTVWEYMSAIHDIADEYQLQILILPVAPHAKRSEKNGKAKGRAMRRERMLLWNELLRLALLEERKNLPERKQLVFLLDYEEKLRFHDESSPVGFVLNPSYNADYTHMNSAFLPYLETSIQQSCCDFSMI